MKIVKNFSSDFIHLFINHFINKIPSWIMRRSFYFILGMKIGKGSKIGLNVNILNPWNIIIGRNTVINAEVTLDGRGGLDIGNNVSISFRSIIITASHLPNSDSFEYKLRKVKIHDNVWLGTGAIVLDGSNIRQGVIISAGSVFKGESEINSIYVGNFAVKVKDRKITNNYHLEKTWQFFR
jgi:acetyltransferase-like isoleucine patch superfamily enzyme